MGIKFLFIGPIMEEGLKLIDRMIIIQYILNMARELYIYNSI
jgi:hypothetical protein